MRTILRTWRGVLAEDGSRLVFANALPGLVGMYAGAAVVSLVVGIAAKVASPVVWTIVGVCGVAALALIVYAWHKASAELAIEPASIIAQIDLERRELLDARGELLARIDEVSFDACRPALSHGPQFEARFGGRTLVLLRGEDWSVTVYRAKDELHARGVAVAGWPPPAQRADRAR